MKAISVRGPWWWFMFYATGCLKDCENRDWKYLCRERGWILIHAAKGMTKREYDEAVQFARDEVGYTGHIPEFEWFKAFTREGGGIVGSAYLNNHVRDHKSKWFTGPTALVLSRQYPMPFMRCAGALGFFEPSFI